VTNNPAVTDESVIRATIMPAAGLLASNVYAIQVDFTTPPGDENGYSGYSQISVFGSASATVAPGPVVAAMNENTSTPDWVVETPSLIAGQLPGSFDTVGDFTAATNGGLVTLTDGAIGTSAGMGASSGGAGQGGGTFVTYTCTNGVWTLTNIVVYIGWPDSGRDGQFYNVSYSLPSAPNTFIPLADVTFNPNVPSGASANRVSISPPAGQTVLASNVAALQFDFTPQGTQDSGYSSYTEIVLQGTNGPSTLVFPPTFGHPTLSGGNLILTGSGGSPNKGYSLLSATNLTPPVTWITNTTGTLDGTGSFSNAIPVTATPSAKFFRLRLP
jgi:hypothetical protein